MHTHSREKMAKLVEMVKNSPLVKRKGSGGYQVLGSEQKDPFAKGITFSVQYYASAEVKDNNNTPAVQDKVQQVCETRTRTKQLRKTVLTVKARCLIVTDVSTKQTDTYPIFLVAYCGGHGEIEDCFYFIHKTQLERTMTVEVFKCSSAEKVKAITLTVAKAFNISYKAWIMEKKKKERANGGNGKGSESPALQRKVLQKSSLTKMAPGIATGGTYTPPAPRKPPPSSGASNSSESSGRGRSGSFGDKPTPIQNPAVVKAMAVNEVTGSTHNVMLTDDFDREFQELAESRSKPEVLRTSYVEEDTDSFSLDKIMAHIDITDN